jgi:hypothetical protein
MTNFNIHNSKIDQLSSTGNNNKLITESGTNTLAENGNAVVTVGSENRVSVGQPKPSILSKLWKAVIAVWKRFTS